MDRPAFFPSAAACAGLALATLAGGVRVLGQEACTAAVRVEQAPQDGEASLRGQRVWRIDGPQSRTIHARGAVRLRLGSMAFDADDATLLCRRREADVWEIEALLSNARPINDGQTGVTVSATTLPIRACIRVTDIEIDADSLVQRWPVQAGSDGDSPDEAAARAAISRVCERIARANQPAALAPALRLETQPTRGRRVIASLPAWVDERQPASEHPSESVASPALDEPRTQPPSAPTPASARPMPRADQGTLTLQARALSLLDAEENTTESTSPGSTILAEGPLVMLFRDARTGRLVQATAQRGVVFLKERVLAASPTLDREGIDGMYLEGEVSLTDGDTTLRASRIYYDLANDRAIMLEAVLWAYDAARGLPLFVRASEIRQIASGSYRASGATLTNSPFLDPELSIGASSITITRQESTPDTSQAPMIAGVPSLLTRDDEDQSLGGNWRADVRGLTLRAYGVPFFYWPVFRGDPEVPLVRSVRFENRSGSGPTLKVAWNTLNLFGLASPSWVRSSSLLTDLYAQRGIAIGTRTTWASPPSGAGPQHRGGVFAWMLPEDNGTDVFKPGTRIDREGEFRGILTADHRIDFSERWSLIGEIASISDVGVIDGLFEEAGESRREFTSRLAGRRIAGNSILSLELKGSLNDFLANEWLLQSQGYSVAKLPEASYVRFADDLLLERPGELVTFGSYSVGRYALEFDERAAQDRGLSTVTLSERALGILPGQSVGDALRARGLREATITRADARQEFIWTRSLGPVRVAPFAVLRGTLYDDTFDGFSQQIDGNDSGRLWSSVGVRASTRIERIYEGVHSDLLDIHRLRHIVEPSVTAWAAGTNVRSIDLPVYDPRVDSLADGAAVRLGIAQTFQTKRGSPGAWRDVDVFRINTDIILASARADEGGARTPITRFFDSRPEESAMGNAFVADTSYALTEATSITGSLVHDLDRGRPDLMTAGLLMRHAPGFSSLIDLRRLDAQDSTILSLWGSYDLTSKYSLAFAPNLNLDSSDLESFLVSLTRRFSAYAFTVSINYNDITSETTYGFVFQPYGVGGGIGGQTGQRFGGFYPGDGGL